VSDTAVGGNAATGPGELVTAARGERPPSAPRLPGRARHKANAAPVLGRSLPPQEQPPSAGMQGREGRGWGAQGRAVGLDGEEKARGGHSSALGRGRNSSAWPAAGRAQASDPRGKRPQRRDLCGRRRHQRQAELSLCQRAPGQQGSSQDGALQLALGDSHLLPIVKRWVHACRGSHRSLQSPRGFLGSRGG